MLGVVRPTERSVAVGDRTILVREAGDEEGFPVVYFHGTPGSRLDLTFGDDIAADRRVRLVSFDRPGYGGSTPAPFGLRSVAEDAFVVADALGLGDLATLGASGGGPFALATAVVGGRRVTAVGVASGAGPFELVPGAIDALDDNDRAAYACLPDDPGGAARGFARGFEPLRDILLGGEDDAVRTAFDGKLSSRDRVIMEDPTMGGSLIASLREGLRPGVEGGGWDNVAWIGPWDVAVDQVRCPVDLWYGEEDLFAPMAHGLWLEDHLAHARLVRRPGEGHFGIADHLAEMLASLRPAS